MFAVLTVGLVVLRTHLTYARPPQQYPILDKVAAKVIAKYQNSSCEQRYQSKSQKTEPMPEEAKVVQFLHSDPQMKTVFINKVAPPIANKMFDCGLIPWKAGGWAADRNDV
ncbi:MAG: hypothetical protein ABSC71_17155 [Candidatus Acidiferrales bacterium]|jgi:hypothetical protein